MKILNPKTKENLRGSLMNGGTKLFVAGLVCAIFSFMANHLYSNIIDGQTEIRMDIKQNFKEISGLSARVAKLEP